ncbi:HK97 gp10 family phage protein [Paenibacillus timonensis]|nr:HK97 gp10 family phage protein [Paenibacillus timonensis]MUG87652.1 HK97 gp10 family phage protein [Paenibacillus timonensis]
MAFEIDFDFSELIDAIKHAPEAVAEGAKRGLHDALDEWKADAYDIAPLRKGALRDSITPEVTGDGLSITGELSANVVELTNTGRRFNYAYYLHEIHPKKHGNKFANPTTPGTVPKFLDTAAEGKEDRWRQMIETEINKNLKGVGW